MLLSVSTPVSVLQLSLEWMEVHGAVVPWSEGSWPLVPGRSSFPSVFMVFWSLWVSDGHFNRRTLMKN